MAEAIVPLGPWPLGVDNVHPADHAAFTESEDRPARLRTARNVVLDDAGWPRSREQTQTVTVLTTGKMIQSVLGRTFYQDDALLYEIGNAVALVGGLSARVALGSFGGRIYGTDGVGFFEIDGDTVRGWGLPVPTVSLAAIEGSTFAAGTYLIECTFVDSRNEGGCSATQAITLSADSNIQVTVTGLSNRVEGINLYVSKVNQPATSFARLVATSGTGAQVFAASAATTVNSPPLTKDMHGPVAGLTGMFPFRAFLMAYSGGTAWRSQAQEPHLFNSKEWIYQVPGTIRGGGGLPSGFALGTDQGVWWIYGDEPPFVGVQKSFEPTLKGALVIEGWKLPFLQTQDPVVLFVQRSGLVAVMPSGEVVPLTRNRYHVAATYTEAHFAFDESAQRLLVGLT